MPAGHYLDDSKRARGSDHPQWKHGKYTDEHRSEGAREKGRQRSRAWSATNKERRKEHQRRYRQANKAKIRARALEYSQRIENRDRAKARRHTPEGKAKRQQEYLKWKERHPEDRRWRWIKTKYGLSRAEYEGMLQSQGGVCKICGAPPKGVGVGNILEVDHCHRTGMVRGLICRRCNTAIAYLEGDPGLLAKMVSYLSATHIRVEVA